MTEDGWTLLAMDSGWDVGEQHSVEYRLYYRAGDGQYLLEWNGVTHTASREEAQEWYQRTEGRMKAILGLGSQRSASSIPGEPVPRQARG